MTQPKKPCKRKHIKVMTDIDNLEECIVEGWNHAIDEMEAYYQPIVEELVEGLELCIKQFQDVHFCQDCGREEDKKVIDEAKQTLAKYKELK